MGFIGSLRVLCSPSLQYSITPSCFILGLQLPKNAIISTGCINFSTLCYASDSPMVSDLALTRSILTSMVSSGLRSVPEFKGSEHSIM